MENCSILNMELDWEFDGEEKEVVPGNSAVLAGEVEAARPGTPDELVNAADEASKDLLPSKSKDRYQQAYNNFQKWRAVKNATSNSERVLLSFFSELGQMSAPSTLWAQYSMLKSTMKIYDSVDISKYPSLIAFLKKKNKGHVAKKAKILTEQELGTFIETAPDVAWLDVKVACIFAIFGACRSHELPNIRMDDILRYDDMYYVTVQNEDTKTGYGNGFAITPPLLDTVKSYENLRPSNAKSDRFFLNYQQGKCFNQVIGVNKFYKMPQRVAAFLNLPDASRYTGHTFRRSSATLYANTGASIEALKRHTRHRSSKVCEGYIEDSLVYKKKRGEAIMTAIDFSPTYTKASSPIAVPCATATSFTNHVEPALQHTHASMPDTSSVNCVHTAAAAVSNVAVVGARLLVPPISKQYAPTPDIGSANVVKASEAITVSNGGEDSGLSIDDESFVPFEHVSRCANRNETAAASNLSNDNEGIPAQRNANSTAPAAPDRRSMSIISIQRVNCQNYT